MSQSPKGLKRLGLESRICQLIPEDISLPAAGQGAIAIEILKNSTLHGNEILVNLNHDKTSSEVMLEADQILLCQNMRSSDVIFRRLIDWQNFK